MDITRSEIVRSSTDMIFPPAVLFVWVILKRNFGDKCNRVIVQNLYCMKKSILGNDVVPQKHQNVAKPLCSAAFRASSHICTVDFLGCFAPTWLKEAKITLI